MESFSLFLKSRNLVPRIKEEGQGPLDAEGAQKASNERNE